MIFEMRQNPIADDELTNDIAIDYIITNCPGIKDVNDGVIVQWDKNSDCVASAYKWALINADFIKKLSRKNQRIKGFQFTNQTRPVAAFNRLLRMCGIIPVFIGQMGRVNQYRATA